MSNANAWRELLVRIFEDFDSQENQQPAWLINPDTNRPLKLNVVYPEIGLAIRFLGLKPGQRRSRLSLEEELQAKQRERARDQLCAAHGLSLITLEVNNPEPRQVFAALELGLSQVSRRVRDDLNRPTAEREALREQVSQARSKVSRLSRQIFEEKDLQPYFALWQDRQFKKYQSDPQAAPPPAPKLEVGMLVDHEIFGLGSIEQLSPSGEDALVSISFESGETRTFLASILAQKAEIA